MLTLILCLIFGPILILMATSLLKFSVINPIHDGCANVISWSIQFKILMLMPLGAASYIVYVIFQIFSYS